MRLVCFDMDGVLFEHANFWSELSKVYGVQKESERLTKLYLRSDYDRLVKEIVHGIWLGKPETEFQTLVKSVRYNSGVHETIKAIKDMGFRALILSSGPYHLASRAQKDHGIDDIMANKLLFKDGRVIGGDWLVHEEGKAELLTKYANEHRINLKDVFMVGDEDNDIGPMRLAGVGIAFNSNSDKLKKVCKHTVDGNDLRGILRYIP